MCITTITVGINFGSVIRYSQKPKTVNLGAKFVGYFLVQILTTKHKTKRNTVIAITYRLFYIVFPLGIAVRKKEMCKAD